MRQTHTRSARRSPRGEDLLPAALAKTAVHWRRVVEGGKSAAYARRVMVNERISSPYSWSDCRKATR